MYHVSAQGIDERMINVHYYYYYHDKCTLLLTLPASEIRSCVKVEAAALGSDKPYGFCGREATLQPSGSNNSNTST